MNAAQAKKIPLDEFMNSLGHQTIRTNQREIWFNSPIRKETDPSFCISKFSNVWYDHGAGVGGNIIDLMSYLYGINNISEALQEIEQNVYGHNIRPLKHTLKKTKETKPKADLIINNICLLSNEKLKDYTQKRGIPLSIAQKYLKEMHYERNGKAFYSLAFPNRSGGYELRNAYFKGSTSPKDITIVEGPSKAACSIFEGFFDFLSALVCPEIEINHTAIILNSVALKDKAMEVLKAPYSSFQEVYLYLDRDPNGKNLSAFFQEQLTESTVIDKSGTYDGFKDLNEYFVQTQTSFFASN